jgi:uncharacterized membrane protein
MKPGLRGLWLLMAALAVLTAAQSVRYISGDFNLISPEFREKYMEHWNLVRTHGAFAIFALAVGPFQFLPGLRRRFLRAHRLLGRAYFVAVIVAGASGFFMGAMAFGGSISQIGFTLIASLWIYTAIRAVAAVRAGRVAEHRAWMIRNYALTFGAVMLRVDLLLVQLAGLDYATWYPFAVWIAWAPNLVVAEWLIRGRVHVPLLRASASAR